MWSSSQRNRLTVWSSAICLLLSLNGCQDCTSKPSAIQHKALPFATLARRAGDVQLRRNGHWAQAITGHTLAVSDAVKTGRDSSATLRFRKGNRITLSHDTLLELADTVDGIVVQLSEGDLTIEITGDDMEFTVTFGKEATHQINLNLGTINVFRDAAGVNVTVMDGQATLTKPGGSTVISTGKAVSLPMAPAPKPELPPAPSADVAAPTPDASGSSPADAQKDSSLADSTVDAGPPPSDVSPDAIVAPDAGPTSRGTSFTFDGHQRARIRIPGANKFTRLSKKTTVLAPGTVIKVRGRKSIRLSAPNGSSITVARGATIRYLGGGANPRFAVTSGEINVRARQGSTYGVVTPQGTIEVSATGFSGRTRIKVAKDGTRVAVSLGRARVVSKDRSQRISPGQVLRIDKNGNLQKPTSMGRARIRARSGKRTRIYYDKRPRFVGLVWNKSGEEEVTLEVARDKTFSKVIMREVLGSDRFNLPTRKGRSYYWRIKRGSVWSSTGQVIVSRDPGLRAGSLKPVRNVIRDTGRETRIIFQGTHPALTLTWKKHPQAASYLVKLYRSQSLSQPMLSQKTVGTRMRLRSGRLKEGTYYWYRAALDGQGKELATSEMNKLTLAFDNAAPLLRIDSPRPGQSVGGQARLKGVLGRGLGLRVNGQAIRVGRKGRFNQAVPVKRGLLKFHIKTGRGDIYFLRHVR